MRSWKRPALRLTLVALVAPWGCVNEYHPEYSPRASYSFSQNVSYPTTVIENVVVAPRPPTALSGVSTRPLPPVHDRPDTHSSGGAGSREAEARTMPRPNEPRPDVDTRSRVADELPRSSEDEAPPGAEVDLAAARTRCRGGDAESCRALPGVHLNGNVRLYGNVVIFGDVFMNDALASSGGRGGD